MSTENTKDELRAVDAAVTGYAEAGFKPTRQYFYKDPSCPALGSDAVQPPCICWHDEGTGPYPDARKEDCPEANPIRLEWRDKPPADVTREVRRPKP